MLMHNVAAVLVAAVAEEAVVQDRQAVVAEAVVFPVLPVVVFRAPELHLMVAHAALSRLRNGAMELTLAAA